MEAQSSNPNTSADAGQTLEAQVKVTKRDGTIVEFDAARIFTAVEKAFRAEIGK